MKLKRLFMLALIVLLGTGTLAACSREDANNKEEVTFTAEEKKKIRKQEEALALFLVNHYEDIKKIEFVSISKGGFGRPRFIYFSANDKIDVSTDLRDSYEIGHPLAYEKDEPMLKEKYEPTHLTDLRGTKVIYYEKNK